MSWLEAARDKQREAAAERVAERTSTRRSKIALLLRPGGMAMADEPRRVATRIDRLSRYHPEIQLVSPSEVAAEQPAAMAAAGAVLERIIKTSDFLGVGYLEAGAAAARAVGRVSIRDSRGRLAGYGTGALVSPGLFLTNHHVLPDADVAGWSSVEFNYQDGPAGRPLELWPFELDPGRFFLADEELDMALVAVRATSQELTAFGFNRLIEAEGKAIVGDFVTIVQHPRGEKKQVALRENRIVDLLELFVHYETDTEPGSSGSPVFNDQWEVVALHHASVPAPDHGELGGVVNEGIRVSRLVKFIRERSFSPAEQALVDQLFTERFATPASLATPVSLAAPGLPAIEAPAATGGPRTLLLSLPIEIRVGTAYIDADTAPAPLEESIQVDRDYGNRKGYDPDFLGTGAHQVPLPALPDDLVPLAAVNGMATGEPRHVLPYHHFSVVLNRERRLAFFTAVNIDGASSCRIKRESDRWLYDPRVPREQQAGEEVYRSNPLDRGHLVRRLDPAWGSSRAFAKVCNDDTFHLTNCTPQHKDFNHSQTTWAGLEDYVLENADNNNFRVSVFTGPVLAEEDQPFESVRLPRQFWKVVMMVKKSGDLSATGYLLSQEELIEGLEVAPEAFQYGAYRTYQVPVQRIEGLTRLSFGSLPGSDPLVRLEAAVAAREIKRPDQIVL